MARIILEGMDSDNTRINFQVAEADIDPAAEIVHITWPSYDLRLKNVIPIEKNPIKTKTGLVAKLETHPITCFESTQTVWVGHPDAIRAYTWADQERFVLAAFDLRLWEGFDRIYEKIKAEPHKYYSGARQIVQGPNGPQIKLS